MLFFLTIVPAVMMTLCGGCAVPQPRGAGRLERVVEPTTERGYWLYLPKDYVAAEGQPDAGRRWPLVVSFHGMKPFDNAKPQAREWQQEADRYGFVVIAPELRAFRVFGQFPLRTVHRAFASDEESSLAILDHVMRTVRVDRGNVLSTSWSSGGYMAHYMINRHPERFSCLAVRQSNFSPTVLDPDATKRSRFHPILIINTQNDFGICKRESKDAVAWYESHGYENVFWFIIKDKGHERTPDLAAEFFARVAGAQPNSPPEVLVRRQAIDGNEEGLAFLMGKMSDFRTAPAATYVARAPAPSRLPTPARDTGVRRTTPRVTPAADEGDSEKPAPRRTAAVPRQVERRSLLKIRVSSAIGIEPLHLGFSAECPAGWRTTANFRWMLDGEPIGTGMNGQKTLVEAGEHTLGLLVVTAQGIEHRATRTIRVLPRLETRDTARRTSGG